MTKEFKHIEIDGLEVKEAEDGTRTVEGFASVFNNVDSYKDIVLPGAFTKSLKRKKSLPMLWQHDMGDVIGKWDELEEREKGLYVKGVIIDTACGVDAYKLLKAGAVTGMSIGYSTKQFEYDTDKHIRKLVEVDLFEVSLVTFPANERAQVTRVKSHRPQTIREFEDFLREAGYSREEATTVALRGYKALANQGEPDEPTTDEAQLREAVALLKSFATTINT